MERYTNTGKKANSLWHDNPTRKPIDIKHARDLAISWTIAEIFILNALLGKTV